MATSALNNSHPSTSSASQSSSGRPVHIPPVAHNFNVKSILHDENVAPSPRTMCAELAHQHALEDLEKHLEHMSGKEDLAGIHLLQTLMILDKGHDLPATNADLAPQAYLSKPEE